MTKLEKFQAAQAACIKAKVEDAKKNVVMIEKEDVYSAKKLAEFYGCHVFPAGLYIFTVGGVEVAQVVKIR